MTGRLWGGREPRRLRTPVVAAVVVAVLVAGCAAAAKDSGDVDPSGTVSTSSTRTARAGRGKAAVVASVTDGDTIRLANGSRVRLLQIDAPEKGGECYSRKATKILRGLLPAGTRVRLEIDPGLDRKDRYGRLLRYVWAAGVNVNVELVRAGAAAPYFYRGERGRYAKQLLRAARDARAREIGLWQACRGTVLDPEHAIDATSDLPGEAAAPLAAGPDTTAPAAGGGCDPSYPDFCIPPPPPDLDCRDVTGTHFTVIGRDPHGFDGNDDGVGCETG